jgi:hypothetical protein
MDALHRTIKLQAIVKDNNGEIIFDYVDCDSEIWWHFLTQCSHYNYNLQVYDLNGKKIYHSERDKYGLPYKAKD